MIAAELKNHTARRLRTWWPSSALREATGEGDAFGRGDSLKSPRPDRGVSEICNMYSESELL